MKTCSNIYDKDEAYIHSIIDKVLIRSEKRYARKEVINSGKIGFKNSAFSMMNKGLSVIFPLVTVSYISRVLGASGVGEVSSAQNLATYFSMAAALGIPSYGVRAIAQSKNDKMNATKPFQSYL